MAHWQFLHYCLNNLLNDEWNIYQLVRKFAPYDDTNTNALTMAY